MWRYKKRLRIPNLDQMLKSVTNQPVVLMLHLGPALGEQACDALAGVRAGRGVARGVPERARAHAAGAAVTPPPPLPATPLV